MKKYSAPNFQSPSVNTTPPSCGAYSDDAKVRDAARFTIAKQFSDGFMTAMKAKYPDASAMFYKSSLNEFQTLLVTDPTNLKSEKQKQSLVFRNDGKFELYTCMNMGYDWEDCPEGFGSKYEASKWLIKNELGCPVEKL